MPLLCSSEHRPFRWIKRSSPGTFQRVPETVPESPTDLKGRVILSYHGVSRASASFMRLRKGASPKGEVNLPPSHQTIESQASAGFSFSTSYFSTFLLSGPLSSLRTTYTRDNTMPDRYRDQGRERDGRERSLESFEYDAATAKAGARRDSKYGNSYREDEPDYMHEIPQHEPHHRPQRGPSTRKVSPTRAMTRRERHPGMSAESESSHCRK